MARILVGCDIQDSRAVDHAIDAFGSRYLDRVYTEAEQRAANSGQNQSLAARYAAKEAVLKLLGGESTIAFKDIEVISRQDGSPAICLYGRAAEVADALGVQEISVSLSHEASFAMAVAAAITLW